MYAQAVGQLTVRGDHVEMIAHDIRRVSGADEITAHMLECLLLRLRRTRTVRLRVRRAASAEQPPSLASMHTKVSPRALCYSVVTGRL